MKNAINYYYNLLTYDVHQNNQNYTFSIGKDNYLLYEIDREVKEIEELYQLNIFLLRKGYSYHRIIINKLGTLITTINNKNYVLMKTGVEKYEVSIEEILQSNIFINTVDNNKYRYSKRNNWYELWSNKVDSLEYLIKEAGNKYKIIRESINYYIGLAETAIMVAKKIDDQPLCISHRYIDFKKNSLNLYNPLNIVIDYPVRDICEIYKNNFFGMNQNKSNELSFIYNKIKQSNIKIKIAFFSRLIFPSYYFNAVEKIINKEENESIIKEIIKRNVDFEKRISEFYNMIIEDNQGFDIEWIKKIGVSLH